MWLLPGRHLSAIAWLCLAFIGIQQLEASSSNHETDDGMCKGTGNVTHLYHTTCQVNSTRLGGATKNCAADPADWFTAAQSNQVKSHSQKYAKKHGCHVPKTKLWQALATAGPHGSNPIKFYRRLQAKRMGRIGRHYEPVVADVFLAVDATGIEYMNFCRIEPAHKRKHDKWACTCQG